MTCYAMIHVSICQLVDRTRGTLDGSDDDELQLRFRCQSLDLFKQRIYADREECCTSALQQKLCNNTAELPSEHRQTELHTAHPSVISRYAKAQSLKYRAASELVNAISRRESVYADRSS